MARANWKKIRAEYVGGDVSYRELAERHGVAFDTLSKRAARENWSEIRQLSGEKVATKLADAVAEKVTKELADYLTDGLKALDVALSTTMEKIRAAGLEFKSLGEAVSSLAKVAKAQADIVGRIHSIEAEGGDDDEDFDGSLFAGGADEDDEEGSAGD